MPFPRKKGFFNFMFATIINDCHCDNARGRQETRITSLLNCPANFIKVDSDLEAAGNLVDALDSGLGEKGVILVNVAPRNGEAKKWSNGTPFGFFYFQDTLVISTIDGRTLSLVKKLGITDKIQTVNVEEVLGEKIPEKKYLTQTQFRSLEFTPRLAYWLLSGEKIKTKEIDIEEVPDLGATVWWVDNFGNIKTSVLAGTDEAERISSRLASQGFEVTSKLKDTPEGRPSLVVGSSGLGERKFLEIVINGRNASGELDIKTDADLTEVTSADS